MKQTDILHIYRAVIWLLVSNNVAGIALNPVSALYSAVFILGIPGIFLAGYYLVMAMRKTPPLHFLIHVCAIGYNIAIYFFLSDKDIVTEIIGGTVWPLVNIALSIGACGLASLHFLKLNIPGKHA